VVASEITAAAFTWSGSVIWVRSLGARIIAGPAPIGPDLVAVVDRGGVLHLLRTTDGSAVVSWALGDRAVADIVADPDLLVMVGPEPGLVCIPTDQLLATTRTAQNGDG
jgi:hypothetical protein